MHALIVVGLGFGDEGKGTVVDYLARQYTDVTVVRFNGGAQAAHNVITPEGVHHTFAQFGAGTLAGARTHFGPQMIVNPMNLLEEARILATECRQWDVFDRLTIDPACLVTTRLHMAWNRIQEMIRGHERHGSTGQGIGATVEYGLKAAGRKGVLRVAHLSDKDFTHQALTKMRDWYLGSLALAGGVPAGLVGHETLDYELNMLRNLDIDKAVEDYYWWSQIVAQRDTTLLDGDLIFEGAQGALLDEAYGTQPHNTWSRCRPEGALNILRELRRRPTRVIGVTRTYMTRHGAGPFPTESPSVHHPEIHNDAGEYQGRWRQGHLDLGLLRYAFTFADVGEIAVTHMDRLEGEQQVAIGYRHPFEHLDNITRNEPTWATWTRDKWIREFSVEMGKPVYITSTGPTADDKEDLCVSML